MPTDNQEPIGDGQETETGKEQGQVQEEGDREQAAEVVQEPETDSEDIALEDDEELDVEIAEVAPRRRSCGVPLVIVFVVAVLVAAALWGKGEWDKKQKELQANEERAVAAAHESADASLKQASDLVKEGNVEEAFSALEAARDKVATAARSANDSRLPGHDERAKKLLDRQRLLDGIIKAVEGTRGEVVECDATIKDLEAQIEDVQAKRAELQAEIGRRIAEAAGEMPPAAAEAPAEGDVADPAANETAETAQTADEAAPQDDGAPAVEGSAVDNAAATTEPVTPEPSTNPPADPAAPTAAPAEPQAPTG